MAAEGFADAVEVLNLDVALGFCAAAETTGFGRRPSVRNPIRIPGLDAFETRDWILDAFSLAGTRAIGPAGAPFLPGVDLADLPETVGVIFFPKTLPEGRALVFASRLIGSFAPFGGFGADFKGNIFSARATVLDAGEDGVFREVERTREAVLRLLALAIRSLPFFIALVSHTVGGSEIEHYGRMQAFATEFPKSTNVVTKRGRLAAFTNTGYSHFGQSGNRSAGKLGSTAALSPSSSQVKRRAFARCLE